MKKERLCSERVSKLTRVTQRWRCRTEKPVVGHDSSWRVLSVRTHRTSQKSHADSNWMFSPLYQAWKPKKMKLRFQSPCIVTVIMSILLLGKEKQQQKKLCFYFAFFGMCVNVPPEISKLLGSEVLHFSWKQSVPLWMPEGASGRQRDGSRNSDLVLSDRWTDLRRKGGREWSAKLLLKSCEHFKLVQK